VPASPPTRPAPPHGRTGPRLQIALLAAAVLAVAAAGSWWAHRAPRLPEGLAPARARAASDLAPGPAGLSSAEDPLVRILERGASAEKESGPQAAFDLYAEAAAKTSRVETRMALLRAMADLARRNGDQARLLRSLDGLAAIPAARGESLLKRGEYFESVRRDDEAGRAYEEARAGADAGAARTATLRLAQAAERGRDALRAQTLYEEILRAEPGSAEALPARVGLAGLYRSTGRTGDARRLYDDILHVAPPGGDAAKAAENALRELDAAVAPEKGEKNP
jgi:tetratricopeptide (TPR) repeat protein